MSKKFIFCERCNKKMIERLPNGVLKFVFGRNPDSEGPAPVEIHIYGSVQMKCLRRTCKHINTINLFPMINEFSDVDRNKVR
jgi:hypothetical protein